MRFVLCLSSLALDEVTGGRAMRPQRYTVLAVLCGTLVLCGWVAAGLSPGIQDDAVRIAVDTPQPPAIVTESDNRVSVPDTGIIDIALRDNRDMLPAPASVASASMPDIVQNDIEVTAPSFELAAIGSVGAALPQPREMMPPVTPLEAIVPTSTPDPTRDDVQAAPPVEVAEMGTIGAALPDPREMQPPATPPVRLASLFRSAPSEEDLKPVVRRVETPNECLVAEICIDDYLWSFYERTPKIDTNKVTTRIKATRSEEHTSELQSPVHLVCRL